MLRRGSAWHDELGSVTFIEIRFQVKEEGAAGAAQGGRELRVVVGSSICCKFRRTKA
jgi:hypothetical protein